MARGTRVGPVLAGIFTLFALSPGCLSSLQDRAAFKKSEIVPVKIQAGVGDIVPFELRPPVREGTRWMLETYPPVRFAKTEDRQFYDWVANGHPIHLEAIIGPWDVRMRGAESGRTSWLWFAANDEAEPEALEMPLPIQRIPYREIAPVSASSAFDIGAREPRLAASYSERAGRVYVIYKTPIDKGTPHLPGVYPMMVETRGKNILYAEVWTDFGQYPFERVGYRVTLSYSADVKGPVELVLVEWTGHGDTAGPFEVHRLMISNLPNSAPPPDASAHPAGSSTPPSGSTAAPATSAAPPASAPPAASGAPPAASGAPPAPSGAQPAKHP
jgi:hypothetical protein